MKVTVDAADLAATLDTAARGVKARSAIAALNGLRLPYGMDVCPLHRRWTFIQRADGTTARRDCPECPRPRGARIINQFTGEVLGRLPAELIREVRRA